MSKTVPQHQWTKIIPNAPTMLSYTLPVLKPNQVLLISQLTVSGAGAAEQNETVGWKTLETLLKLFCQGVLCGR